MRTPTILKNLALILLLALAGSGAVSAKLASGPQNLGPGLHQVESVLNLLMHQGETESSDDGAAGSSVVTKGAMARGREAEARVLNDLGLPKNTQKVTTAEGNSIPDALTDTLSVEIKDAARVSRTRQVRIQTQAAKASGRESILVTGERTCVSGNCAQAFDRIIRRSDLGPQ